MSPLRQALNYRSASDGLLCIDVFIVVAQALKMKAFNNFTAIYLLLLERLRLFSTRASEHRLAEDHRRPSTVAEQAVVRFTIGTGDHPPSLGDTHTGL